MPTPRLGRPRHAQLTAGLKLWLHHSPRTSVHIPQSGPRALPRECTLRVTPCEGASQGWYGGPAPPQVGKTQEALLMESPSLRRTPTVDPWNRI